MIKDSGVALLNILNDILDLSKLESGKLTIEQREFDLRHLIDECLELVAMEAKQKKLQLIVDYRLKPDLLFVSDPYRIRQVLLNLPGNAVKFTGSGFVKISVLQTEKQAKSRPIYEIDVIDSGIGIPEQKQQEIFKEFVQGELSFTRKYGGTGLGLAISKRIVELLGGEISLFSSPGKGSTFRCSLPLRTIPAAIVQSSSPDSTDPSGETPADTETDGNCDKHLRILVADDNRVNQLILGRMLEKIGIACTMVSDGLEAVAESKKERYDLLLLDIEMPGLNGIEALKRIRSETPDYAGIPALAFTAHVLLDNRETFLDAGFSDFVAKPVTFEDLKKKIGIYCKE